MMGYQGPQEMQVRAFISYEVESSSKGCRSAPACPRFAGPDPDTHTPTAQGHGKGDRGQESRDILVPSCAQLWLWAMLLMAEPSAEPSHPTALLDASASDRWSLLLEQFNTSCNTETLKKLTRLHQHGWHGRGCKFCHPRRALKHRPSCPLCRWWVTLGSRTDLHSADSVAAALEVFLARCGHAERQKGGFISPFRAPSLLNNNYIFSHTSVCLCSCSPVGDTVKFKVTLRR